MNTYSVVVALGCDETAVDGASHNVDAQGYLTVFDKDVCTVAVFKQWVFFTVERIIE